MARAEATHGTLAMLPGEYNMLAIGVAPDEATGRSVRAGLNAMLRTMAAHASGLYLNLTEHRVLPARLYPEETSCER